MTLLTTLQVTSGHCYCQRDIHIDTDFTDSDDDEDIFAEMHPLNV